MKTNTFFITSLFFTFLFLVVFSCNKKKGPEPSNNQIYSADGVFTYTTSTGLKFVEDSVQISVSPWFVKMQANQTAVSDNSIVSVINFRTIPVKPLRISYVSPSFENSASIELNGEHYEGEVAFKFTNYDSTNSKISGLFDFKGFNSLSKELKVTGQFKNVVYQSNFMKINSLLIPNYYENTFNGAMTIKNNGELISDTIVLTGIKGMYRFGGQFKLPANISEGTYSISPNDYKAFYIHDSADGLIYEPASTGSITITKHNKVLRTISAFFNFQAPTNEEPGANYSGEFHYSYN